MESETAPIQFLNLEYFFRILYEGLRGGDISANGFSGLISLLSNLWLLLTVLAYLFSLAAIGVFVYATMRIYQIRQEEEELYSTISQEDLHEQVESSRWAYIQQLINSGQEANWRQAIIEADIVLDELLTRLGYIGDSVGEKLKAVNPNQFRTIQNAWEAHKVRNEIAHQGSAYQLSEHLAHRTIKQYEAVFIEHEEL